MTQTARPIVRTRGITPTGSRAAFTLIELLVVISIIALLIGILLPALGAARASARSALCKTNMRSASQGILTYANDFDGYWAGVAYNGAARHVIRGGGSATVVLAPRSSVDRDDAVHFSNPIRPVAYEAANLYWSIPYEVGGYFGGGEAAEAVYARSYPGTDPLNEDEIGSLIEPFAGIMACPEAAMTVVDPGNASEIGIQGNVRITETLLNNHNPVFRYQSYALNALVPGLYDDNESRNIPTRKQAEPALFVPERGYPFDSSSVENSGIVPANQTARLPQRISRVCSRVIFFQDHSEVRMEGDGDTMVTLSNEELNGWHGDRWKDEIFRHAGSANLVFTDGSVGTQRGELQGEERTFELYLGTDALNEEF